MLLVCFWFAVSPLRAQVTDSLHRTDPDTWETFTDMDGGFSVRTPGPMELHVDTAFTPMGKITYHTFYHYPGEDLTENQFYMVSYCDYPKNFIPADSTDLLDAFWETTIEAAVEQVHGTLIYQTPAELENASGYLWRIHYNNDQAVIKTKAMLKDDRYYSVQTVTFRFLSLNKASDAFLDSFRIL